MEINAVLIIIQIILKLFMYMLMDMLLLMKKNLDNIVQMQ